LRVIAKRAVVDFAQQHPDAKSALEQWYKTVSQAMWKSLVETRQVYPSADLVGRRTVFNIKGNSYRLIARVTYRTQRVFILHILTHADYDKGDWKQ
jgi:mRNA interferase HigB